MPAEARLQPERDTVSFMTGSEEPGCLARPTRRSTGPLVFLMPQSPSDSACPRYFTVNVSGSSSCARNPPSCVFELLPDISPQHRLVKASTCDKEKSISKKDILVLRDLLRTSHSPGIRRSTSASSFPTYPTSLATNCNHSSQEPSQVPILHLPQREIINPISLLKSLLEFLMLQESVILRLQGDF